MYLTPNQNPHPSGISWLQQGIHIAAHANVQLANIPYEG